MHMMHFEEVWSDEARTILSSFIDHFAKCNANLMDVKFAISKENRAFGFLLKLSFISFCLKTANLKEHSMNEWIVKFRKMWNVLAMLEWKKVQAYFCNFTSSESIRL